jgi:hypothetical protein
MSRVNMPRVSAVWGRVSIGRSAYLVPSFGPPGHGLGAKPEIPRPDVTGGTYVQLGPALSSLT